ncbi:MAG: HAD-IA family hydrolase [Chloroflexi bacterium]|nr:HAD-IA family hydrolase [Chloroflexota bacterium]
MLPQPNPIRAVIFDLDDTLIDWSGQELHGVEIGRRHLRNVYQYLATQELTLPEQDLFFDCFGEILVQMWTEAKKTWAGVAFRNVFLKTFHTCGLAAADIDIETILQVYDWQPVPGIRPFPDTLPVLKTLRQQGYKIGLITNSMQPMWMRDVELEAYGLIDYLDARITSGDTGYMKPHPRIYGHVLDLLAVEPHQALFVGDQPTNDIVGANDSGLISVLISHTHLNYDLNDVQPDYTITRLNELLPILEELRKYP